MSYRIPIDLKEVKKLAVLEWPVEERLRVAMAMRLDASIRAKLTAVAISMNEQPKKVPNGNCAGIMCQGLTYPWGWQGVEWNPRPVGYALLREGATGVKAPFLAFARVEDSLGFLIDRVIARCMYGPDTYALSWVGARPSTKTYAEAVKGFEFAYDKVVAALWQMAAKYAALPMTGPA